MVRLISTLCLLALARAQVDDSDALIQAKLTIDGAGEGDEGEFNSLEFEHENEGDLTKADELMHRQMDVDMSMNDEIVQDQIAKEVEEMEDKEEAKWIGSTVSVVSQAFWDHMDPMAWAKNADMPSLPKIQLFAAGDRMDEIQQIQTSSPDLLTGTRCYRRNHIADGIELHNVAPTFAPNGECSVPMDTDQVGKPLAPPICIINHGMVTHDGKHIITGKEVMILTQQNHYYQVEGFEADHLAERLVVCSDYDGQSLSNFMGGCVMKLTTTFLTYLRSRNGVKIHIKTDDKKCDKEPCRCATLSPLMKQKCAALRAIGLNDVGSGMASRFIGGSPQASVVMIGNSPLAPGFFYHALYANIQRKKVREHLALPATSERRLPLIVIIRSAGKGWSRWSSQTKMILKKKYPTYAVVEFDAENPPPAYKNMENRWRLCAYAEAVIAPADSDIGSDCDFANPGGIFVEVESSCGDRETVKQSAQWHSYLGLDHHHLTLPAVNTFVQAKMIADYVVKKIHEGNVDPVPEGATVSEYERLTVDYPPGWEQICELEHGVHRRVGPLVLNGVTINCSLLDQSTIQGAPKFRNPAGRRERYGPM